jgi:hypothetical protein
LSGAVDRLAVEIRSRLDGILCSSATQNEQHIHMWTAPACKGSEYVFGELVGCGHMSGPFARRIWPLALMEFADRVPIKNARSSAH